MNINLKKWRCKSLDINVSLVKTMQWIATLIFQTKENP